MAVKRLCSRFSAETVQAFLLLGASAGSLANLFKMMVQGTRCFPLSICQRIATFLSDEELDYNALEDFPFLTYSVVVVRGTNLQLGALSALRLATQHNSQFWQLSVTFCQWKQIIQTLSVLRGIKAFHLSWMIRRRY